MQAHECKHHSARLCKHMLTNSCVDVHSLGSNGLGAAGATAIAEALKVNRVLKSLNLTGSYLEDAGRTAIRDAVNGRVDFNLKL